MGHGVHIIASRSRFVAPAHSCYSAHRLPRRRVLLLRAVRSRALQRLVVVSGAEARTRTHNYGRPSTLRAVRSRARQRLVVVSGAEARTRTHNYGRPSTHLEPHSALFTYSFSTASLESMAWCLYRDAFGECIADGKTCSDPVTGVGGGPRGPYCWTGNITLFQTVGAYAYSASLMYSLPTVVLCLVCCGWCPMLAGYVCWARSGKCECLYYDEAETPQAGPSVPVIIQAGPSVPVIISNPTRVAGNPEQPA